jgi:predicted Zn-dependent protease
MSRIEVIKKIIEQTPQDPFPRYGLAMEYKQAGMAEEAHSAFAALEQSHPDYVAQYLMHGNLLTSMQRVAEARGVLERGMAAAQRKRDQHALGELQQALAALPEE